MLCFSFDLHMNWFFTLMKVMNKVLEYEFVLSVEIYQIAYNFQTHCITSAFSIHFAFCSKTYSFL